MKHCHLGYSPIVRILLDLALNLFSLFFFIVDLPRVWSWMYGEEIVVSRRCIGYSHNGLCVPRHVAVLIVDWYLLWFKVIIHSTFDTERIFSATAPLPVHHGGLHGNG